ncbi:DNA/RNA nuclease SfsA [Anaerofustis stercorihominis]|uniref:DNA/RNA nuclease SfsA n=1 Tax=Anaerofustis stercorihominis TaxID=214853 RepID=UPI00214ABB0B|nr:DNA/RNA nuclease SfsA [Anaerofustis stercorihominis]MCR2032723.1 DNA/RNA nuclease SfsA [Anaerofustis stercorihominis]
MKYKNIVKATFINRPNRFIAKCKIGDIVETVHVKNTGRCRELLKQGAAVYLEKSDNPNRNTKYDLISVYKNDILFNMDSQIPNKIFREALENKIINLDGFDGELFIKNESTYGNSRFDFYVESKERKAYIEIKGVTLEEEGIAMFPDAPTIRGIKHINELVTAHKDGYEAYMIFIIQFKGAKCFTPNPVHDDFINALKNAKENGVNILAFDCDVTGDEIKISKKIDVKI